MYNTASVVPFIANTIHAAQNKNKELSVKEKSEESE